MKKAIIIVLLLSTLLISNDSLALETYNITIYKDDTCISCRSTMDKVFEILETFDNHSLTLRDFESGSVEEIKELTGIVPRPNLPLIIINNSQILDANNYSNLEPILRGERVNSGVTPMSLGLIIVAGFIDGINPCALAMLILFITALSLKINKLKVGISYILGTFVAYYGLGLGFLKISYSINTSLLFSRALSYIVFALCIYVSFIHFKDFYYLHNNIFNKTKTQLKGTQKKRVQDFITTKSAKYNSIPWFFFVGFVVAIFEFACTGQTYVPILLYIASNDLNFVLLLTLYNIMFVMPLLIVLVLSLKFDTYQISLTIHNRQKYFKLAIALLFLALAMATFI